MTQSDEHTDLNIPGAYHYPSPTFISIFEVRIFRKKTHENVKIFHYQFSNNHALSYAKDLYF